MATGASTADLAVILIDARKGVLTQTRRHSYIVVAARHPPRRAGGQQDGPGRLFAGGLRRDRGATIAQFAAQLGLADIVAIPLSALQRRQRHRAAATHMPWYTRPDAAGASGDGRGRRRAAQQRPFRLPVQWVNRPNLDFRGFAGTHRRRQRPPRRPRSARCPRARPASVARIVTADGDLEQRRRRPGGHADARRTRSTSAAATC